MGGTYYRNITGLVGGLNKQVGGGLFVHHRRHPVGVMHLVGHPGGGQHLGNELLQDGPDAMPSSSIRHADRAAQVAILRDSVRGFPGVDGANHHNSPRLGVNVTAQQGRQLGGQG